MSRPIYLDHAATTALRPEVRAAMEPFLSQNYANPSSIYRMAQAARSAVDAARDTIVGCLGARSDEMIFTSGGTESNNAAIKGTALARQMAGRHVVTSAIEHHAVLYPMQELQERFHFDVAIVPVSSSGVVDPTWLQQTLRPETVLISCMWANNEIGTVQPVEEIGKLARDLGVPFHVDAVQVAGALTIDLRHAPIDLMSISAHKFYGPKGIGALYVRRGTPWWPLLVGGRQERNRRAGTENVAGIVGMAEALRLACLDRETAQAHACALRDCLIAEVMRRIPNTHVNGDLERRLPNNANFTFDGVQGESLLVALDLAGIMASSGSACTSGSTEPSHVLTAIGLSDDEARGSLRLTVGRESTMEEMVRTVDVLVHLVERQRLTASKTQRATA
ncbi:MAG: cysteine desulfurase family protein [Chloroflexota bacterium]|nr:MAG: cysteine desulfurase NifS [Chloroflexota bacterium]